MSGGCDKPCHVSLYSIMVEFMCLEAVTNLVKSFGKIHDEDICLLIVV